MSLFSEDTITKLGAWRKNIMRIAIWLLIAGVAAGVILILCSDVEKASEVISKTMGTIFLAATAMIVWVIGFRLIESKKTAVQTFSTICIATSLIWAILWALGIWAWRPVFETCRRNDAACTQYMSEYNRNAVRYGSEKITDCPSYMVDTDCELTILARLAIIITIVSGYTLIAAGILNMYDGKRRDAILPLKIASLSLAGYAAFYLCLMVATDWPSGLEKLAMLAGFAGSTWFNIAIVAWVISRIERSRDGIKGRENKRSENLKQIESATMNQPEKASTDEELRTENEPQTPPAPEIQQTPQEIIEQESQEQLEKQQGSGKIETNS